MFGLIGPHSDDHWLVSAATLLEAVKDDLGNLGGHRSRRHTDGWCNTVLDVVDDRLTVAPFLVPFAAAARPIAGVVAMYVGGSLASGDYRPGISDLDLVAFIEAELDEERQARLIGLHQATIRADACASNLHCIYVPVDQIADLEREHLTWAFDELFERTLSGIARAELLGDPVVVYGPAACDILPAMDRAAIATAARAELAGYWTEALNKPDVWREDVYVDLGLLTVARVVAAIDEGRLITKAEAIRRLHVLDVDEAIVGQIASRRRGEATAISDGDRSERAVYVRSFMTDWIATLTQT